ELIEFGLVFGHAQAVEEFHEFALLFFKAAKRLRLVFVESTIAARRARAVLRPRPMSGPMPTLVFGKTLPAIRPPFLLALPTLFPSFLLPARHSSAPNEICQSCQAQGPKEDETTHHQSDPGGFADLVQFVRDSHHCLM